MLTDELSTQLDSTSISPGSLRDFPLELVLAIADIALKECRNGNSTSARRFSHVSRSLRAYTMPSIYKILNIDVSPDKISAVDKLQRKPIIGHDGREHEWRPLALLSWLLHDPTSEIRKHVEHIVFTHTGSFKMDDICPNFGVSDAEWEFDKLVVRYRMDAIELYRAGIRAREVHHITFETEFKGLEIGPLDHMANASGHMGDYKDDTCGHLRFWAQIAEQPEDSPDSEDGSSNSSFESSSSSLSVEEITQDSDQVESSASPVTDDDDSALATTLPPVHQFFGIVHRQLDPKDDHLDIDLGDTTRHGQFIMVELHGDQVIMSPEEFANDIAVVLDHETRQTVVLVHDLEDIEAADQALAIIASARKVLTTDAKSRLRVSHTNWNRELLLEEPVKAYSALLWRDIDP